MARSTETLIKEKNVKIIIIDSLMALMRSEYVGIGMLAARQQVLNRLIHDLSRIAETYDVAVLLTNQVATSMKGMYAADDAIGGNIVAHGCHFRMQFKAKGFSANSSLERRAIIVDAPDLPPDECTFFITDEENIDYPEMEESKPKKAKKKSKKESKASSAPTPAQAPSSNIPVLGDLEDDFESLKQAGFEEKYAALIEHYTEENPNGAGAVYSRGMTKDFISWIESKHSMDSIPDPLAAIEEKL